MKTLAKLALLSLLAINLIACGKAPQGDHVNETENRVLSHKNSTEAKVFGLVKEISHNTIYFRSQNLTKLKRVAIKGSNGTCEARLRTVNRAYRLFGQFLELENADRPGTFLRLKRISGENSKIFGTWSLEVDDGKNTGIAYVKTIVIEKAQIYQITRCLEQ